MQNRLLKAGVSLAILGGALVASAQDVPWQVDGGKAAVQFWNDNLRAYGIEVKNVKVTAPGEYPMEGAVGFNVLPNSTLQIMTENQYFGHHLGGQVQISGGFELRSGKRVVSVMNPTVRAEGADQDSPLTIQNGISGGFAPGLLLEKPITYFDAVSGSLIMGWSDMRLTKESAIALGHPEAAGLLIGGFSIWSTISPTQPIPKPQPGGNGLIDNLNVDMNLFAMSSLTSSGRDGVAYPNGISGFAVSTTSCNKGTTNIDWFQAMNANHPIIGQQLYRVRDGRIEQIGAAYLKHGFLATNSPNGSCGVGVQPGTNQLLGVGLTDTYGVTNNNDRFWLGPRSEVNPFTGVWTPFNSLFDVGNPPTAPDGVRSLSSGQASAYPGHAHRIEVRDQDLIIPAGESRSYIYEAFYLNTSEINWQNQIGVRNSNVAWNGSSWVNSDITGFVADTAAIQYYVTMMNAAKNIPAGDVNATVNKVNDLTEGWTYVACNPIRLGGGLWRYEISVFNYTSDRQIREVKVPMMPGMTVTNIGFRDADWDGTNQWTGSYSNTTGEISWSTQTQAQNPNANSLKYGLIYNFSFTANVAPVSNVSTLGLFKTGPVMTNTANLVAPPNGNVAPATYTVTMGTPFSGGVSNIVSSDNSYAIIDESLAQENIHACSATVTGTSPIAVPGQITLEVESAGDLLGRFQVLELWNYTTGQFDVVGSGGLLTTDTTKTVTITGVNASKYVNPATKEVKSRLNMDLGSQENTFLSRYKIDKVKWLVGL